MSVISPVAVERDAARWWCGWMPSNLRACRWSPRGRRYCNTHPLLGCRSWRACLVHVRKDSGHVPHTWTWWSFIIPGLPSAMAVFWCAHVAAAAPLDCEQDQLEDGREGAKDACQEAHSNVMQAECEIKDPCRMQATGTPERPVGLVRPVVEARVQQRWAARRQAGGCSNAGVISGHAHRSHITSVPG